MLRRGLTTLLVVVGAARASRASDCGSQPPRGFGEEGSTTYRVAYVNRDACYSVQIPEGLTGHGDGFTEHGLGLVVPPDPTGFLYVEGKPNAWDAESAEQEIRRYIEMTDDESQRLSAATEKAALGGLPAARAVVRYHCPGSSLTYVREHLVALSPGRDTIFDVSLYTQESTYDEHRLVLDRLVKTWRFETSPGNPLCVRTPSR